MTKGNNWTKLLEHAYYHLRWSNIQYEAVHRLAYHDGYFHKTVSFFTELDSVLMQTA